jgi:hypothetical protein
MKQLLEVRDLMRITGTKKPRAYEILRRNPNLVIRLGKRQIRIDPDKLEAWLARGGCSQPTEDG